MAMNGAEVRWPTQIPIQLNNTKKQPSTIFQSNWP